MSFHRFNLFTLRLSRLPEACRQKSDHVHLSFLTLENAGENPTIRPFIGKVLVFHPSTWLVSMSTECPFPDRLEEGVVNRVENFLADDMTVIERPPTNLWVEFSDQFPCRQITAFLDPFSNNGVTPFPNLKSN